MDFFLIFNRLYFLGPIELGGGLSYFRYSPPDSVR